MILETDAPKQSGKVYLSADGLIRSQRMHLLSHQMKNNGQNYIVSVTHLL